MAKKKAEVIEVAEVIEETLAPALIEIKTEYGLKLRDEIIDTHISTYSPYFKQLIDLESEINELLTKDVNSDTEKLAKEVRKKYADIRISCGKQKDTDKEDIVLEGGFLDKINRRVKEAAESKEQVCKEIEDRLKKQAEEAKAKLKSERTLLLNEQDYDTDFLTVEDMPEESFNKLLATAIKAKTALDLAAKQAEQEKENQRKIQAEKDRRVNMLAKLGITYNDETNSYENDKMSIDADQVFSPTTEKFELAYKKLQDAHDKAAQEAADKANMVTDRINQMSSIGLVYNKDTNHYERNGAGILLDHVKTMSDADFDESFQNVELLVQEQKLEEAKAESERLKALEEQKKAIEEAKLLKQKEVARLQKEKQDKEEQALKAKKAALAPDREKFIALCVRLAEVKDSAPVLQTPEGINAVQDIIQGIDIVLNAARQKAKDLKGEN